MLTKQFYRLPEVIGNAKAKPPLPGIFPVSRAHWYRGIKEGYYPKPVHISKGAVAWRAEDLSNLIEKLLKTA